VGLLAKSPAGVVGRLLVLRVLEHLLGAAVPDHRSTYLIDFSI
jgi:hypothetical protein